MDDRGFIVSFLLKLVLPVVIVALALFEVGGVVISRTQANDLAGQAATQANLNYFNSHSESLAEATASEFVTEHGMKIESFSLDPRLQTITVGIAKTSPSLILKRIDSLKKYTDIHVTQSVPIKK